MTSRESHFLLPQSTFPFCNVMVEPRSMPEQSSAESRQDLPLPLRSRTAASQAELDKTSRASSLQMEVLGLPSCQGLLSVALMNPPVFWSDPVGCFHGQRWLMQAPRPD